MQLNGISVALTFCNEKSKMFMKLYQYQPLWGKINQQDLLHYSQLSISIYGMLSYPWSLYKIRLRRVGRWCCLGPKLQGTHTQTKGLMHANLVPLLVLCDGEEGRSCLQGAFCCPHSIVCQSMTNTWSEASKPVLSIKWGSCIQQCILILPCLTTGQCWHTPHQLLAIRSIISI